MSTVYTHYGYAHHGETYYGYTYCAWKMSTVSPATRDQNQSEHSRDEYSCHSEQTERNCELWLLPTHLLTCLLA